MQYKYNQFAVDMGKRISERRKSLGITQEQLAERINVSTQTISYAEQGAKALRSENLAKLSSVLQVSADYILTGKTPASTADAITEKLSHLSDDELVFVEMIVNSCIGLCNLKRTTSE